MLQEEDELLFILFGPSLTNHFVFSLVFSLVFSIVFSIVFSQEEDELEFSVCLPSPTLEPTALLTNDHTEPVVFILGWEVFPSIIQICPISNQFYVWTNYSKTTPNIFILGSLEVFTFQVTPRHETVYDQIPSIGCH